MTTCASETELLGLVDGELDPQRAAELERHVASCAACTRRSAGNLEIHDGLAHPAAEPADQAFVQQVVARLDEPAPVGRRRDWRWIVGASSAALAAAALVVLFVRPAPPPEFQPRGGPARPAERIAVDVHLITAGAGARELLPGQPLSSTARLAFRVLNPSSTPPLYLLAFGVDAAGEVHWFYPAWHDAASDPAAAVLPAQAEPFFLPDAVAPEGAAPGPFRIVSVLSDQPATVRATEARLGRGQSLCLGTVCRVTEVVVRLEGQVRP